MSPLRVDSGYQPSWIHEAISLTEEAIASRAIGIFADVLHYCGQPDIEHRTTKVRRPQSNGFIERLHRTLLDEHFRIQGRTKWYESLDEMQKDLDSFLSCYNQERPHQGRNMKGQTPGRVFLKGLPKTKPAVSKKIKQAA